MAEIGGQLWLRYIIHPRTELDYYTIDSPHYTTNYTTLLLFTLYYSLGSTVLTTHYYSLSTTIPSPLTHYSLTHYSTTPLTTLPIPTYSAPLPFLLNYYTLLTTQYYHTLHYKLLCYSTHYHCICCTPTLYYFTTPLTTLPSPFTHYSRLTGY